MDRDGATSAVIAVATLVVVLQVVVRKHVAARVAARGRPAKRRRTGPKRRGQRLQWSYDELTDFEFERNYRMSKAKFKQLVEMI